MIFTIPLPPSINRTYRTGQGRFFRSHQSHDWEDEALYTIMTAKPKIAKHAGRVKVDLWFYFKRDSDIDSRIKAVLDVLEESKLIKNDMDVIHLDMRKYVVKSDPKVEVKIEDAP